jgi:hypothetical protein
MKKEGRFWTFNIACPILMGFILYVLFRPDTHISKLVYTYIGIEYTGIPIFNVFTSFIKNFACDILWAYSLTFTVSLLLGQGKKQFKFSFVVCAFFEILMELLQMTQLIGGTFDILDILFEIMTTAIALLIIIKYRKKRSKT